MIDGCLSATDALSSRCQLSFTSLGAGSSGARSALHSSDAASCSSLIVSRSSAQRNRSIERAQNEQSHTAFLSSLFPAIHSPFDSAASGKMFSQQSQVMAMFFPFVLERWNVDVVHALMQNDGERTIEPAEGRA